MSGVQVKNSYSTVYRAKNDGTGSACGDKIQFSQFNSYNLHVRR